MQLSVHSSPAFTGKPYRVLESTLHLAGLEHDDGPDGAEDHEHDAKRARHPARGMGARDASLPRVKHARIAEMAQKSFGTILHEIGVQNCCTYIRSIIASKRYIGVP